MSRMAMNMPTTMKKKATIRRTGIASSTGAAARAPPRTAVSAISISRGTMPPWSSPVHGEGGPAKLVEGATPHTTLLSALRRRPRIGFDHHAQPGAELAAGQFLGRDRNPHRHALH